MSIFRLKTRQFNFEIERDSIERKKKLFFLIEFVFFSLCPRHSLSQKQPVQTREEISSSSSLFLDCKTIFLQKEKKKLRVFHRRKNQSRALENQNLTHASPALTPFSRSVPSFICFLVHVPGVGAKFMSGFFFFLCSFSCLFLSRKNCSSPSSLSSSFLSSSFSRNSLFWGVRKRREKIYLSKEARVFVQRERRIFAPPLTLERYRRKGNSRRYYFFLLSFLSLLCCSFRGGEQSVSSVCDKKGGAGIFSGRPTKKRKK